jgi:hypothetical protein
MKIFIMKRENCLCAILITFLFVFPFQLCSLVKDQKAKVESAHLSGIAMSWLLGVYCIGFFAAGYMMGLYKVPRKDERSEVKELEA